MTEVGDHQSLVASLKQAAYFHLFKVLSHKAKRSDSKVLYSVTKTTSISHPSDAMSGASASLKQQKGYDPDVCKC